MSNETIMLAKTYKSHKDLIFPLVASEKLDGVPGDFYANKFGTFCRSRQDKEILSVDHILEWLDGELEPGMHVIGELYIPGEPFKNISGLVRTQETNYATKRLNLYIHDFYEEGRESTEYEARMLEIRDILDCNGLIGGDSPIKIVPTRFIQADLINNAKDDYEAFDMFEAELYQNNPTAEGLVARTLYGPESYYKSGWRSPGILKSKQVKDIDLPIHSLEEAVSKSGEPLGMVGRINVVYNDEVIGVGPGKLTHAKRTDMYKNQDKYIGKMIEIHYMPDASYDALREARFDRFRPDRD